MQGRIFVFLFLSIAFTEGFLFSSKPKCQIKTYKASKYITGDKLLVHEDFIDRVKPLENLAKDCKVILYIKGSYYQLPNPAQQVLVSEADIAIGHGFQFELRDEKNALLCNKICLSNNPMSIPAAQCFLQGAISRGLTWSRFNANVLSDGTYAANTAGYQTLKTDIQTRCKDEKLKRELIRALRKMYEEDDEEEQAKAEVEKKK
ncbi:unnamed protein product [Rotaria magnacalcarata]|uniref:Uncharacterized protein n=2 Tax=Rotaria magnacalcarata TaxID=392030 RepID=A0A814LM64_9BILA|nr:unnamed protein product [Rotaria magnacalcarata]CAF1627211.1 unnamed protein product [Rotaria magnacalcarata]CAF2044755.1 unnamed protein product [Rotaria magnacalcarata]CAF2060975.1 unnamed protein product [Rotaria magnacalcarata]CAF2151427.1 unnamed protein product [Rotaria magnacalcarata]